MTEAEHDGAASAGINVRGVRRMALLLLAALLCAGGLAWLGWHSWRPSRLNEAPAPQLAEPMLESTPQANRRRYQADKDAMLLRWGWDVNQPGIAQIPIAEAQQLLIERDGVHGRRP